MTRQWLTRSLRRATGRALLTITGLFWALTSQAAVTESQFQTSDGVRLTYLQAGAGDQVLLFVPGWLMPADVFQHQLSHFERTHRVYALNPRSQGSSQLYLNSNRRDLAEARARDIREWAQHLGLNRFVLIGWSLGVMEALDYLNRFGDSSLEAMVLIDNSIGEGQIPVPKKPSKPGAKKPLPIQTRAQFEPYIEGFVEAMFKHPDNLKMKASASQSALRLADTPDRAFDILRKPYPRDLYRQAVYSTAKPVWYAVTPAFREQAALFAIQSINGKITVYEQGGHAFFAEVHQDFNRDLALFLESLQ